jgi:hypothetical protein
MRLTIIMLLLACTSQAAVTNWHGRAHANPAIGRAIERRTMAPAKPRVVMQHIEGGEVISVLRDGTVVREPLKRASTARIPEALGRVRIDRALARIAASVEGSDNAKRARELEKLADKLEKGNGKAKAAAAIGGALAATAAAYLAGRKGRVA